MACHTPVFVVRAEMTQVISRSNETTSALERRQISLVYVMMVSNSADPLGYRLVDVQRL